MPKYDWIAAAEAHGADYTYCDETALWRYYKPYSEYGTHRWHTQVGAAAEYCKHYGLEFEARVLGEKNVKV